MFHTARMVASFALLGAVLAGATLGWHEHASIDFRVVGATVGGVVGLIGQFIHS